MGFNKRYLPEIEFLEKKFKDEGIENFVNFYRKADCFIGPSESVDFVIEKLKIYEKLMNREKLLEIIHDELGRHQSKSRQEWGLFHSNCNIMCGIRLANEAMMTDHDSILALCDFIKTSWTDLELSDEQIDAILQELIRLRKS